MNSSWIQRLSEPRCMVIGHRGACGDFPENTRASFDAAWRQGAEAIEFDIRWSRDGVPVVIHDATLERTGQRPGLVAGLDWSDLSTVDVGSWMDARFSGERLMRLEELIEAHPGRLLNIELKESIEGHPELGRWLGSRPDLERYLVSSFLPENIRWFHANAPQVARSFLFDTPLEEAYIAFAKAHGCLTLNGSRKHVGQPEIARIREAGFPTLIYTVNEAEEIRHLARAGVAGLFTNFPGRMAEIVKTL